MQTESNLPAPRASLRWLAMLVLAAAAIRLGTLGAYPLMDTTESRYAEVAREMIAHDDWVTPRIDGGQPFWAKPPLSMWATMTSFIAFGYSEFAARFGAFVFSIGTLVCVVLLGRRVDGSAVGWCAAGILMSTAGFFTVSGAVMTDASLVAAVTLALAGYGIAMHAEDRRQRLVWGFAFFAGLGLTMLAKGPVGIVLTVFPIAAWCLIHGKIAESFQRLPWMTGAIAAIAIAAPWYVAAERATPGFLDYFIVGEHVQRFLVSDWEGDRYGNAHSEVPGTIWFFAFVATLPWVLLVPWLTGVVKRQWRQGPERTWVTYLFLWMITPMLFFTPARNVLPSYVAPGLPAFALLCALVWRHLAESDARIPRFAASRSGFAALVFVIPLIAATIGVPVVRYVARDASHKQVAELIDQGRLERIVYVRKLPYSAQFYTHGRVSRLDVDEIAELTAQVQAPGLIGVAVERSREHLLPPEVRDSVTPVMNVGKIVVFAERDDAFRREAE